MAIILSGIIRCIDFDINIDKNISLFKPILSFRILKEL
jgi:hypothetical protein